MNGAESLVHTLVDNGVDVCFTNPGTSEMHFVAALDKIDGMRCVLGLFEGVVSGAADGYARMADKPAATLLHLGPGLANAAANLHNARKANTPMVNIVGEHATYHIEYDAPLTADIEGIAAPFSHWVRTSPDSRGVAADAAEAITAAKTAPGQIATLILPGDTAWNEANGPSRAEPAPARALVDDKAIEQAATTLKKAGGSGMLLLSGMALREEALEHAARIRMATGCRVMAQGSNARLQRGAGRLAVNRIPYPVDQALEVLKDVSHLVLLGAKRPVAFFAYPDKPSVLTPEGCEIQELGDLAVDARDALARLAEAVGAPAQAQGLQALDRPDRPTGGINPDTIAAALGALLPEQAIVCDESVTTGRGFYPLTAGAPAHDWLQNMGGSIGLGMPLATGAAIACPDRKVLCLEGDGSGMYTVQALWTQAREKLDVTTLVFANRTYQILKGELANVGAGNPGRKAIDMLDIGRPDLNWVKIANGMGVEAVRVETAEELCSAMEAGLRVDGPFLIEVMI